MDNPTLHSHLRRGEQEKSRIKIRKNNCYDIFPDTAFTVHSVLLYNSAVAATDAHTDGKKTDG